MREYKEGKYTIRELDGGTKWYYFNKRWHREEGPAIEWENGHKSWFLNGKQYTEPEWKNEMRKRKLEVLEI